MSISPLEVLVNGEVRALTPDTTVAELVDAVGRERRGTAVAVNGEVVPRSAWDDRLLAEHDRVEMLTAAPGG